LSWLPDLDLWARQIAAALKPGGVFYLLEGHPLVWALSEQRPVDGQALRLELPYLAQPAPMRFSEPGTYAGRGRDTVANDTCEWSWGLGDIVSALVGAGLALEWLREHPLIFYPAIPELVRDAQGYHRLPGVMNGRFPLSFSLRATRSG
jgi:hypothetical protein